MRDFRGQEPDEMSLMRDGLHSSSVEVFHWEPAQLNDVHNLVSRPSNQSNPTGTRRNVDPVLGSEITDQLSTFGEQMDDGLFFPSTLEYNGY